VILQYLVSFSGY